MDENAIIQQAQDAENIDFVRETEEETVQTPDADTVETDGAPEAVEQAQEPKKRRGGRKPFTAAQKAAAAKAREEAMQKAANLTPEVHVQYQDSDAEMQTLIAAAKEDFRTVKKRMRITDMKLYVKPEERTAYYVVYSGAGATLARTISHMLTEF